MVTKKQKINQTLARGLKEMRMFRESKPSYIIPLQQSGNKMYKAYIQLLELITKKNIRTTKGVEIVTYGLNDRKLIQLFKTVRYLHTFFYEGQGGKAIKEDIVFSAKTIKQIMRRY